MGQTPYATAALAYVEQGWDCPLPLPARCKNPPPPGFTGADGQIPDAAQLARWVAEYPGGNVALRLPIGVLVLDVDAYDGKRGADTLTALEAELGPLPATYVSTNRGGTPSGHRFYRVPSDVCDWKGELAFRCPDGTVIKNIDLIHLRHRFVVAPPSVHPEGRVYEWIGPDGENCHVPRVEDLPTLPESWVAFCRRGRAETRSRRLSADTGSTSLDRLPRGEPCEVVLHVEGEARLAFSSAGRHETALHVILVLLRHGQQGHHGVRDALERLKTTFVESVDRVDSSAEWDRAVAGALQQMTIKVVPTICSCEIAMFRVLLSGTAGFSKGFGGVGERDVLRHFVDQAERTHLDEVRLSERQLAEKVRKPHQAVHRVLKRLVDKQWLRRTRRPSHGLGTTYRINVPQPCKVMTAREEAKAGSSAVITTGASKHFLFSASGLGRGKAETLAALNVMGVRLAHGRFLVPTGRSSTSENPRLVIKGRLPAMQRMVPGQGKTAAEVARTTGKSASTVSGHLKDLHALGLVYKDRKRRWWGLCLLEDRVADELGVGDRQEELQQGHRVERMYFTLASALNDKSNIQVVNDGEQPLLVDTAQGTILWRPATAAEAKSLLRAVESHGISLPDVDHPTE